MIPANVNEQSLILYLACSNNGIRLMNGQNAFEGRVEVCIDRMWKTVCNDEWGFQEAAVVCRQLGRFGDGSTYV